MSASRFRSFAPVFLLLLSVSTVLYLASGIDLIFDRGGYKLNLQFEDGGQLIDGAKIKVAGTDIGRVTELRLASNGMAEVEASFDRSTSLPLHQGTTAAIRSIGQVSTASRYVDISPGPTNQPQLPSGATLDSTMTRGIVDTDSLLGGLDTKARSSIRKLIRSGASIYAGSTDAAIRQVVAQLGGSTKPLAQLTTQYANERSSLTTAVSDAGEVASKVSENADQLQSGIKSTSEIFGALATRSGKLRNILERGPGFIDESTRLLKRFDAASETFAPLLEAMPAFATQGSGLLQVANDLVGSSGEVTSRLSTDLPALITTLRRLQVTNPEVAKGLQSLTRATKDSLPIAEATRIYGLDVFLNTVNGTLGNSSSNYDATGHYSRGQLTLSPQLILAGSQSGKWTNSAWADGLFETQTKVTNVCPGGLEPPAPDGSNRYYQPKELCDPQQSVGQEVLWPLEKK